MKRQYVGIDLHRRTSTIYRMSPNGKLLGCVRVPSQPFELAEAMKDAGEAPEVVLESTYGWYWAADLLKELGANVHLAHPLGNNWGARRVKNDERDAEDLAAMLRLGRLAEGWIAPPEVRELRELVRYRFRLVHHRTSTKNQIHGVMAKNGILPARREMWGPGGEAQLDSLDLPMAYTIRMESLRDLLEIYDREIDQIDRHLYRQLKDDPGYKAITKLNGVGRVLGAIFVAEIGDVARFDHPRKLCCWAGLTPRHRESDAKVQRGPITRQGSPLVRWAAIEAVVKGRGGKKLQADYHRIEEHAGRFKARVAVARKLLTLVYYGLRDGEIRSLEAGEAA
ncbi:MAG TPA: IS110 family transposase [Acidimicrobiales bacterium]|nr:IS110 family transposase [Acidimicrobiales bacterium]